MFFSSKIFLNNASTQSELIRSVDMMLVPILEKKRAGRVGWGGGGGVVIMASQFGALCVQREMAEPHA